MLAVSKADVDACKARYAKKVPLDQSHSCSSCFSSSSFALLPQPAQLLAELQPSLHRLQDQQQSLVQRHQVQQLLAKEHWLELCQQQLLVKLLAAEPAHLHQLPAHGRLSEHR